MADAGIVTLALALVLLPIQLVWHYFGKIRLLDPCSAARTKASHGAGMAALALWAFFLRDRIGLTEFGTWVPLALLGVGGFGLFWLVNGWRMAKLFGADAGDEFQIARAVVKIGVGVGIFWLLRAGYRVLDYDIWLWLVRLQWPVQAVAIWCFISGGTKFALLLAVKRRAPLPPPVHANPHGDARSATPGEARRMRQGHGGGKSRIDDMQF